MTRSLQWDDLSIGMSFTSASRTITEADIVGFATLTGDFSELHTSEEFALKTEFGRRVAHGLLGLSYAHGLMWARSGEFRDCAIAFLGLSDWRFRAPIFIGDTIHVRYSITSLRVSRSDTGHGIASFAVSVINQAGAVVQEGVKVLLCSTAKLALTHDGSPVDGPSA